METVIRAAIEDILSELDLSDVGFSVEHPADLSHGDFATNVALIVGKQLGRNPLEFANELTGKLEGQIEYVDHIEVAGPGFINFYLSRDFFTSETERIIREAEQWGKNVHVQNAEVLIEYTSPNLFKPLHIGNLVGNIIGESLTRIFEHSGAVVHRLNYPSDIGLTVAKGVWGLQKIGGDPDNIAALGEAYVAGNTAYEEGGVAKEEIEAVNRALYARNDDALNELRDRGIATSRARLNEICKTLGTEFDVDIPESEAGPIGTEIVNEHIDDGVFEKSDGAVIYRGEEAGLHTRVFLNSQGLPTYEAKDLGNFTLKQQHYPDWTHSIVVTGGEQADYFKVIFSAIRDIFTDAARKQLEHIPTGFLTLTTGKMSSRKGNVLTGESLLEEMKVHAKERAAETRSDDVDALAEEIAVAALKYQILRQKVGSNIVFDKEQALSFEGDSGPYLQYTHARICSVLDKSSAMGIEQSIVHTPSTPYEIERITYRFPEIVVQALSERSPHYLAVFLTELAGAFNAFYAREQIADASDQYAPYKVAIAAAVRQTLANGLWLLGIKAPDRM